MIFSQMKSDNIKLNEFRLKEDKKTQFSINGKAKDFENLSKFYENVKKYPDFEKIKMNPMKNSNENDSYKILFKLESGI